MPNMSGTATTEHDRPPTATERTAQTEAAAVVSEEDRLVNAILDDQQKEIFGKLSPELRTQLRDGAHALARFGASAAMIKKGKEAAQNRWLLLIKQAEAEAGVTSIPFQDPNTGDLLFAYRRADPTLSVDPAELRVNLAEYHEMELKGEEEDRATYVSDIMGRVLKPEAIDNEKFRTLVTAGVIPKDLAAASSEVGEKSAWVAFEKPKPG